MSLSKAVKITSVFTKYPIMKGMASYALIWPVSSIIHQTMEGKRLGEYWFSLKTSHFDFFLL